MSNLAILAVLVGGILVGAACAILWYNSYDRRKDMELLHRDPDKDE